MANIPLNEEDQTLVHAFDEDAKFNEDNTSATITGHMKLVFTRPAENRYLMEIEMPDGIVFPVLMDRSKELLGIAGKDKS